MPRSMTIADAVIAVARVAAEAGRPVVTAEELAVDAWKLLPVACSLKGFPHYPDSNKVFAMLMGKGGLVAREELKRVGPRQYSLGPKARKIIIEKPEAPDDGAPTRTDDNDEPPEYLLEDQREAWIELRRLRGVLTKQPVQHLVCRDLLDALRLVHAAPATDPVGAVRAMKRKFNAIEHMLDESDGLRLARNHFNILVEKYLHRLKMI